MFRKTEQAEMAHFDECVSQIAYLVSLGFPSAAALG
jgi:hypothetical protein